MRYANTLLGMCCALALTATPVFAADTIMGSGTTTQSNHSVSRAEDGEWISLTGKVAKVDDDELTIRTGSQSVAVDASDVDNFDRNRVRVGDRVSVSGEMDEAGLFDGREIEANTIVVLSRNAPATSGGSS